MEQQHLASEGDGSSGAKEITQRLITEFTDVHHSNIGCASPHPHMLLP
jgi:hypothetical protein